MTSKEVRTATRAELQEYLENRGFGVYEDEETEDLRTAAQLDINMVEEEEPDPPDPYDYRADKED